MVSSVWWSALFSASHLLALGIGLGAVYARGQGFKRGDIPAILRADSWWGLSAILWVGTGLMRVFGGVEKGWAWYSHNPLFWGKMGLFLVIWLLELVPMIGLIRWRIHLARGQHPDLSPLPRWTRINQLELALIIIIPFVAAGMARGIGL